MCIHSTIYDEFFKDAINLYCKPKYKNKSVANFVFQPHLYPSSCKTHNRYNYGKLLNLQVPWAMQFIKQINQYKILTAWKRLLQKKNYFLFSWYNRRTPKRAFFPQLIPYSFIFTYLYLRPQNMQRITSQTL